MPGTTWNWIRCSKFSSRVRSLQKPGTEPSPVFHWASEGNLLPTSTCQRSHTPLPIWPSKTNSSRKIENAAVIEGKKKRVSTTFEESIQRHQPPPIWAAFATVDFDSSYDYKAERRSKRL